MNRTMIQDRADIQSMQRTGYPAHARINIRETEPHCPICGQTCDKVFYTFADGIKDIIGCDECILSGEAWEEEECF